MARDMTGSFSKNENKTTDKHPDIKGSCVIRGEELWFAAWRKEGVGHGGKPRIWYSCEFTPKDKPKAPEVQTPIPDDDIPF